MSDRITEIPEDVRDRLPEDLQDAEIDGTALAGADESVRIHGPPGTGKTTQTMLRAAAAATERGLQPGDMTVVTYRRSLADESAERFADWAAFPRIEVSGDVDDPYAHWGTIHSVAASASGFWDHVGDSGAIAEDGAAFQFCNAIGVQKQSPKPWVESGWTAFRKVYNYAKSNLLDLGRYRNIPDSELDPLRSTERGEELYQQFRQYWPGGESLDEVAKLWEAWKRENEYYDYWEMLDYAIDGSAPPLRYVVVDEFQDVDPLLFRVVQTWLQDAETALIAGDPDQCINEFEGSSPLYFERGDELIGRSLPEVTLRRSYRCPFEHYSMASNVLSKFREHPRLTSDGFGEIYRYSNLQFEQAGDTGGWGFKTDDYSLNDTALSVARDRESVMLLARSQQACSAVARGLDVLNVAYESQDGVAGDWNKRYALLRALRKIQGYAPERPDVASERLSEFGNDAGWLENADPLDERTALTFDEAEALVDAVKHTALTGSKAETRAQISEWRHSKMREITLGRLNRLVKLNFWPLYACGEEALDRCYLGPEEAQQLVRSCLIDEWRESDSIDDLHMPEEPPYVGTIHSSKGREAEDVVLFDGVPSSVPDNENESRTWYVALTRASERLHVVRDAFPWTESYLPSRLEYDAERHAQRAREQQTGD